MKKFSFGEAIALMKVGHKVTRDVFMRGDSSPIEYKYIALCSITKHFGKVIKAKDEAIAKTYEYSPASCEMLANDWYIFEKENKR